MGLDQYGFVFQKANAEPVEFQWRKHSRLQDFMEKIWEEQEPEKVFNCEDLPLTEEHVKKLIEQIEKGYVDNFSHGGFFYGEQFQEEAVKMYKEKDEKFATSALKALQDGGKVIYSCWW